MDLISGKNFIQFGLVTFQIFMLEVGRLKFPYSGKTEIVLYVVTRID